MASETVYDATIGSLTLRQVTDTNYSGNATPIYGTDSGDVDPAAIYGGPADPRATFNSRDIASVLGVSNVVTAGIAVESGTITIPYQKRDNAATFEGGSNHVTLSATNGLTIPTSFSCSQDDNASVSLETTFFTTDGLTNPVSVNVSQSLSSQSFVAMFGLGPIVVNSSQVVEGVGFTVNPGISVITERHDGGLYPDRVYIVSRRPSIDLNFNNFNSLSSFSSVFTSMSNCSCYFRRRSGTGYASTASSVHAKFSFTTGIIATETLGASAGGSGVATLRLYGEALTATAASQISV